MFKKISCILIFLIFIVVALFSSSGDTLILKTKVKTVLPTFGIRASFSPALDNSELGTQTGTIIYSNADITNTTNIIAETLYVSVFQENKSRCKNSFNLSVSATALEKDLENKTNDPSWFLQTWTSNETLEVKIQGDAAYGTQEINTVITYKTGVPVEQDTELFRIAFSWRPNATLDAGEYTSTIKLTYTAK